MFALLPKKATQRPNEIMLLYEISDVIRLKHKWRCLTWKIKRGSGNLNWKFELGHHSSLDPLIYASFDWDGGQVQATGSSMWTQQAWYQNLMGGGNRASRSPWHYQKSTLCSVARFSFCDFTNIVSRSSISFFNLEHSSSSFCPLAVSSEFISSSSSTRRRHLHSGLQLDLGFNQWLIPLFNICQGLLLLPWWGENCCQKLEIIYQLDENAV